MVSSNGVSRGGDGGSEMSRFGGDRFGGMGGVLLM